MFCSGWQQMAGSVDQDPRDWCGQRIVTGVPWVTPLTAVEAAAHPSSIASIISKHVTEILRSTTNTMHIPLCSSTIFLVLVTLGFSQSSANGYDANVVTTVHRTPSELHPIGRSSVTQISKPYPAARLLVKLIKL